MAGEVLAVGDGVNYRPGARVSAATFVGAFAEQAVVDARAVSPIPDGIDYAEVAAFGVTYRTAYYGVAHRAPGAPGATGRLGGRARGSGGIGLAAVDIGKLLGGRVLAAASGEAKLDLCRERGAEACGTTTVRICASGSRRSPARVALR